MPKPSPKPAHRARSAEAKAERRDQILQAARAVFDASAYDAVTIAAIAERAELAKGAAYRYFETKEALFLALLTQELESWLSELAARLRGARRKTAEATAQIIAGSFTERATLTRLLPLLHTILERNVTEDDLVRFKHGLLVMMAPAASALEAILALKSGEGVRLLVHTHALIVGMAQLADQPPVLRRLLQRDPALASFRVELDRELTQALAALLRGAARRA